MKTKLSASLQGDLAALLQESLGVGEADVQMGQDGVLVSVLVEKSVFGEVRVEFEDFDAGHWEVQQRVALWNHSVNAHKADDIARILVDVGARVRKAEAEAIAFMKRIPGARVSSEFEPVKI
jgi:hypothetical protein